MTLRYLCTHLVLVTWLLAAPALASVDVSSFGARGDGKTDDTAAIQQAINSVGAGGTLTFGGPNQIFLISSRLSFQPNRIYQGQGTLLMSASTAPHTAIAKLSYGAANNVTIQGITFDSNGVGGGLQLAVDGSNAFPATSIVLDHLVFRNATQTPTGPWDSALYAPVGLTNSQVTNNQVINCGIGYALTDISTITISNNLFQKVHVGDAISVVFTPAPFAYGQAIQISQNSGQHLGRMAIEMWPNGGNVAQTSQVQGMVISGNTFSEWDLGYNGDTFGISLMAGQQNSVLNNKLVGPNIGYGIEVGTMNTTVSQNCVNGFATGIIMHDSSNSTLNGNLLSGQSFDGIELSNAPGTRTNLAIQNNSIINPQIFGILANTSSWGGTTISGNFISRTAGFFSTDPTGAFTGIATTPPTTPVTVTANSITQSGTTGPATFVFIGIRLNGNSGDNASSSYQNNNVISQVQLSQSYGLYGNSSGTLNGTVVTGNTFTGLYSASGGSGSSGAVSSGNLIYNCTLIGPLVLIP